MQSLLKRVHNVSRNEKGFTLVELIVVVAIIAILTAVLLPKLLGYTDNARESRAKGDLASMKSVVEAYAADQGNGKYPAAGNSGTPGTIGQVLSEHGIKTPTDPWGNSYYYAVSTDQSSYVILSKGKGGAGAAETIYVTGSTSPKKGDPNPSATGSTPAPGYPSDGTLAPIQ
ncbi:prepilin-type N-terminal cleavage/methylation domain-containing protein [Aceticella autotrophica]|uniref:Prepilin-type N-terminal cleavage/methylation domain-containing protein n=1 Tax=Aceticella autotrophica TaxID=2755338 RepID=A0A975AWZ5_9THEO|nr:prepilin-type N-terminal cleavage/methylation domain-containing protein [Aceticella autotrophica]QSZ28027.1 prepilin-type N-terminal cleavage/methylation domain-containing protein [Aceticella autotrophica]